MEVFAEAAEMMPSYLLSGIPGAMAYAYYYTRNIGQVPELFAGEGPFLDLLRETCPILKEEYRPPPLVHESRLMTIVASLGRHRGLNYPFMREIFMTTDGGEIALDWWDSRLKPSSGTEIPVVPSSSFVDSISYYYNSFSSMRFPIPQIPEMKFPEFHIPYFGTGPLKRSASVTGSEMQHLDSVASDIQNLVKVSDPQTHISSPDTDMYMDTLSEDGEEEAEIAAVLLDSDLHRSQSTPGLDNDEEEQLIQSEFLHPEGRDIAFPTMIVDMVKEAEQNVGALIPEPKTPETADDKAAPLPITIPEPKGIVLILPGLTGDSTRNYVQGLIQVVEQLGFTAVVMNYRGATGNLKACFMADTEDVAQLIHHLKGRYPAVPILAVGVSLGGILLTNYVASCGRENKDSLLLAVMTVSVAWNFFASAKELEQPLNWLLFNRMLTRALCDAVTKHSHVLQQAYDLEGLKNVKTLREFDNHLTAKMFGYSDADEYYKKATLHDKVGFIKTPLLAINAADDMFSPYDAIPKEDAKKNPLLCILVTSHGGHIGFLEGRNPFGTNYVERVFQQFAKAAFDNDEKISQFTKDLFMAVPEITEPVEAVTQAAAPEATAEALVESPTADQQLYPSD